MAVHTTTFLVEMVVLEAVEVKQLHLVVLVLLDKVMLVLILVA